MTDNLILAAIGSECEIPDEIVIEPSISIEKVLIGIVIVCLIFQ